VPAILAEPVRPGSQVCIISHFTLIERMTNSQRLATVRERFLYWLQNADEGSEHAEANDALICRESVLFRDEFFCGRKFIGEHFHAVWFIEEDVLKIYRAEGPLELVLRGTEIDEYGAEPVEEHLATENVSVAPLSVSQAAVPPLRVTSDKPISDDTSGEAIVPEEAVAQELALQDAVRADTSADASTHPPVATPEVGPRILQLPAASGDSSQPAAAGTADQIEQEQSETPEIRKAA
jgi:hypothetical protein